MSAVWSAEEIAALRLLWPDREKSCRTIAAELSLQFGRFINKNAVIGRVNRLKLPQRTRSRRDAAKLATSAWRAMHVHDTRPMGSKQSAGLAAGIRHKSRKTKPEGRAVGIGAIPSSRMISLVDLQDGDCHWPCGDPQEPTFAFCGLPAIGGKSYCLHHNALAWVPVKDRKPGGPRRPLSERSAIIGASL